MNFQITARKDSNNFFITTTDLEMEKHPEFSKAQLDEHMANLADEYYRKGYEIKLSYEVE